jgi:hypothetical protein
MFLNNLYKIWNYEIVIQNIDVKIMNFSSLLQIALIKNLKKYFCIFLRFLQISMNFGSLTEFLEYLNEKNI